MMEFPIFVQTLGFIIHPNLMVKEWCMKMSYKTMIYAEWISYVRQKWECKRIQTITNSRTQIIERNQKIYKSTFCKRMFVQVWPNNIIFETWGISVSEFDTGRNITNMRKSLNEPGHQLSLIVLIRCEKPTLAPFRVFTKVAPTPFWLIFSLFFFFFLAPFRVFTKNNEISSPQLTQKYALKIPASVKCTSLEKLGEGITDITCQLINKFSSRNAASDESQDFGLL